MDEQKLQEFLGRALVDLGGAVNAVLMSIGDELGCSTKPSPKAPRHLPNFPAIPTPTSVMLAQQPSGGWLRHVRQRQVLAQP